ncbi:MAG: hypothetical protein ABSE95_18570 [Thermodesulfobacteriota bacterium]
MTTYAFKHLTYYFFYPVLRDERTPLVIYQEAQEGQELLDGNVHLSEAGGSV